MAENISLDQQPKSLSVGDAIRALSVYPKDMLLTLFDKENEMFYGVLERDIDIVEVGETENDKKEMLCINNTETFTLDDIEERPYSIAEEVKATIDILTELSKTIHTIPALEKDHMTQSLGFLAAFNQNRAKTMLALCDAADGLNSMVKAVELDRDKHDKENKSKITVGKGGEMKGFSAN